MPFVFFSVFGDEKVREAETEIRKKYPEAAYIELEPDSSTHNMFALEQFQTPALRKVKSVLGAMDYEVLCLRVRMCKSSLPLSRLNSETNLVVKWKIFVMRQACGVYHVRFVSVWHCTAGRRRQPYSIFTMSSWRNRSDAA